MNAETYEKIVTDRIVFGKPAAQIAKEIDRTEKVVYYVVAAFETVRDKDWNRAIACIGNQRIPIQPYEWAAQKLEVELPPALAAAYEDRKRREREQARLLSERMKSEEAEPETTPEKTPEAPAPEMPAANAALFLIKILEAINQQNELLNQLMDAVIPKYVGDMKDNVNANSDCLFNQLKEISDTLGVVKNNTRKRGL